MTGQHTHRWSRAIAMVTPYRPLRAGPDIVLARKRADPWERIYALEELALFEFLVALLSKLDVDSLIDVGANDGHFGSKLRWHGYHDQLLSLHRIRLRVGSSKLVLRSKGRFVSLLIASTESCRLSCPIATDNECSTKSTPKDTI